MNFLNEYVLIAYSFRYMFVAIFTIASVAKLFYLIYRHSYKSGFLRERSIDISLISIFATLVYPVYYVLFAQEPFIKFIVSTSLYSSTITLLVFLLVYAKLSKLSFYKIADFVYMESLAFYLEVTALSLIISYNVKNLVLAIAFIVAYFILKNAQKFGFSSILFGFVKVAKSDEVTLIGVITVLFLIYHSALAILLMFIYERFNLVYLIFLSLIVIYCFIKLSSLSKANKVKWMINLFQHKKKDLEKKENFFSKKLID